MKTKSTNKLGYELDDEGVMMLLTAIVERARQDAEIYESALIRIYNKKSQLKCTPQNTERDKKIYQLTMEYDLVMAKLDSVLKWLKDLQEENHVWFY